MTARSLRIAFFGTPDFAVPTLERLIAGPHPVVSVTTQPDRPRGRGRRTSPSPVAEVALREGIPLLRPEKVGDPEAVEVLRQGTPDLGVVVAFGQFLTRRVREAPSLGYLINGHASLLPRYRGAAPIARAILEGESETGISVMRIEREMDAGPVAATRALRIGPDESTGELEARLSELAAEAIADVVEQIADDRVQWTPQDPEAATHAAKIERAETRLDWSDTAERLVLRVRAMAPAPGAFTTFEGESLRILAARAMPGAVDASPGTARCRPDAPLRVATGDGWLLPLRVQRAGGKALGIDDYLRGRPIPDGARLI